MWRWPWLEILAYSACGDGKQNCLAATAVAATATAIVATATAVVATAAGDAHGRQRAFHPHAAGYTAACIGRTITFLAPGRMGPG